MKLWLDDIRTPPDNSWSWVKSVDEAISFCDENGLENIEEMSLDHDLGNGKSGYDFINWLEYQAAVNNEPIPMYIFSHSMNTVGRNNIEAAIHSMYKRMLD